MRLDLLRQPPRRLSQEEWKQACELLGGLLDYADSGDVQLAHKLVELAFYTCRQASGSLPEALQRFMLECGEILEEETRGELLPVKRTE